MQTIGVRELKARVSNVLREVRERRTAYGITYRGKVIAHLVPTDENDVALTAAQWQAEWDQLTDEIGKHVRGPVDAVELVREGRSRW